MLELFYCFASSNTPVYHVVFLALFFLPVDAGFWLVPRSPDLSRGREKENKDPSPKVQRRRSLKISSTTLEPAQWQNERAQIICSASDLKCMDEFLQKKVINYALLQSSAFQLFYIMFLLLC